MNNINEVDGLSKREEDAITCCTSIHELECVQKKLYNRIMEFDSLKSIHKELSLVLHEQIDHKNKSLLLESYISLLPEESLLILCEAFPCLDYFQGASVSDIFSICLENLRNAIKGYRLLYNFISDEEGKDLVIFLQKQKEYHLTQIKKLTDSFESEIENIICDDFNKDINEEEDDLAWDNSESDSYSSKEGEEE